MDVTLKERSCRVDQNRRHSKLCYIGRKLLVCFLAFLMFCSSIVPANAATVPSTSVINLMEGALYQLYVNDVLWGNGKYYGDPSFYVPSDWNATDITLLWEEFHNVILKNVYVTIQCRRKPSELTFYPYAEGATPHYVGQYVGSPIAGLYTYYFPDVNNGSHIRLKASWGEVYSGSFNIVSCFGSANVSENIPVIEYELWQTYVTQQATLVQEKVYDNPSCTLPYGNRLQRTDQDLSDVELTVKVNPNQRDTDLASSLDAVFYYHGEFFSASAALYDSSGSLVTVLNCVTSEQFTYENLDYSSDELQFDIDYRLVTVDLSGYNLKDISVVLNFDVGATYMGDMDKPKGALMGCHSVWITPYYEEPDNFGTRVLMFLINIKDSIAAGVAHLSSLLVHLFDGGEAGEALEEAGAAMSDQASDFNAANDQLNSADKPDLDSDQLLSGVLDFDTHGLTLLSSMTSNQYVTQLMIVVFTCALCGFVFFGKK